MEDSGSLLRFELAPGPTCDPQHVLAPFGREQAPNDWLDLTKIVCCHERILRKQRVVRLRRPRQRADNQLDHPLTGVTLAICLVGNEARRDEGQVGNACEDTVTAGSTFSTGHTLRAMRSDAY